MHEDLLQDRCVPYLLTTALKEETCLDFRQDLDLAVSSDLPSLSFKSQSPSHVHEHCYELPPLTLEATVCHVDNIVPTAFERYKTLQGESVFAWVQNQNAHSLPNALLGDIKQVKTPSTFPTQVDLVREPKFIQCYTFLDIEGVPTSTSFLTKESIFFAPETTPSLTPTFSPVFYLNPLLTQPVERTALNEVDHPSFTNVPGGARGVESTPCSEPESCSQEVTTLECEFASSTLDYVQGNELALHTEKPTNPYSGNSNDTEQYKILHAVNVGQLKLVPLIEIEAENDDLYKRGKREWQACNRVETLETDFWADENSLTQVCSFQEITFLKTNQPERSRGMGDMHCGGRSTCYALIPYELHMVQLDECDATGFESTNAASTLFKEISIVCPSEPDVGVCLDVTSPCLTDLGALLQIQGCDEWDLSILNDSPYDIRQPRHASLDVNQNERVPGHVSRFGTEENLWAARSEAESSVCIHNKPSFGTVCKNDSDYFDVKSEQKRSKLLINCKDPVNSAFSQVCVGGNAKATLELPTGVIGNLVAVPCALCSADISHSCCLKSLANDDGLAVCQPRVLEEYFLPTVTPFEWYDEALGPFGGRIVYTSSTMGQSLSIDEPTFTTYTPFLWEEVDVTIVHFEDFAVVHFTSDGKEEDGKESNNGIANTRGKTSSNICLPLDIPSEDLTESIPNDNTTLYDVAKTRISYSQCNGHVIKTEVNDQKRLVVPADFVNNTNGGFPVGVTTSQAEEGGRVERICIADITRGETGKDREVTTDTEDPPIVSRHDKVVESELIFDGLELSNDIICSSVDDNLDGDASDPISSSEIKKLTYIADKDVWPLTQQQPPCIRQTLLELAERYREQEEYDVDDDKGFIFSASDQTSDTCYGAKTKQDKTPNFESHDYFRKEDGKEYLCNDSNSGIDRTELLDYDLLSISSMEDSVRESYKEEWVAGQNGQWEVSKIDMVYVDSAALHYNQDKAERDGGDLQSEEATLRVKHQKLEGDQIIKFDDPDSDKDKAIMDVQCFSKVSMHADNSHAIDLAEIKEGEKLMDVTFCAVDTVSSAEIEVNGDNVTSFTDDITCTENASPSFEEVAKYEEEEPLYALAGGSGYFFAGVKGYVFSYESLGVDAQVLSPEEAVVSHFSNVVPESLIGPIEIVAMNDQTSKTVPERGSSAPFRYDMDDKTKEKDLLITDTTDDDAGEDAGSSKSAGGVTYAERAAPCIQEAAKLEEEEYTYPSNGKPEYRSLHVNDQVVIDETKVVDEKVFSPHEEEEEEAMMSHLFIVMPELMLCPVETLEGPDVVTLNEQARKAVPERGKSAPSLYDSNDKTEEHDLINTDSKDDEAGEDVASRKATGDVIYAETEAPCTEEAAESEEEEENTYPSNTYPSNREPEGVSVQLEAQVSVDEINVVDKQILSPHKDEEKEAMMSQLSIVMPELMLCPVEILEDSDVVTLNLQTSKTVSWGGNGASIMYDLDEKTERSDLMLTDSTDVESGESVESPKPAGDIIYTEIEAPSIREASESEEKENTYPSNRDAEYGSAQINVLMIVSETNVVGEQILSPQEEEDKEEEETMLTHVSIVMPESVLCPVEILEDTDVVTLNDQKGKIVPGRGNSAPVLYDSDDKTDGNDLMVLDSTDVEAGEDAASPEATGDFIYAETAALRVEESAESEEEEDTYQSNSDGEYGIAEIKDQEVIDEATVVDEQVLSPQEEKKNEAMASHLTLVMPESVLCPVEILEYTDVVTLHDQTSKTDTERCSAAPSRYDSDDKSEENDILLVDSTDVESGEAAESSRATDDITHAEKAALCIEEAAELTEEELTYPLTGDSGYQSAGIKDQVFIYETFSVNEQALFPQEAMVTQFSNLTPESVHSPVEVLETTNVVTLYSLGSKTIPGRRSSAPVRCSSDDKMVNENEHMLSRNTIVGPAKADNSWDSPTDYAIDSPFNEYDVQGGNRLADGDLKTIAKSVGTEAELPIEEPQPRGVHSRTPFTGRETDKLAVGELSATVSPVQRLQAQEDRVGKHSSTSLFLERPSVTQLDSGKNTLSSQVQVSKKEGRIVKTRFPSDVKVYNEPEERRASKATNTDIYLLEGISKLFRSNSCPCLSIRDIPVMSCFGIQHGRSKDADVMFSRENRVLKRSKSAELLRGKRMLGLFCGSARTLGSKWRHDKQNLLADAGTQTEEWMVLPNHVAKHALKLPAIGPTSITNSVLDEEKPRTKLSHPMVRVDPYNKSISEEKGLQLSDAENTVNKRPNEGGKTLFEDDLDGSKRWSLDVEPQSEVDSSKGKVSSSISDLSYLIQDTRQLIPESDFEDAPPPSSLLSSSDSLSGSKSSDSSQISFTTISTLQSQATMMELGRTELQPVINAGTEEGRNRTEQTRENIPSAKKLLRNEHAEYWDNVNSLSQLATRKLSSESKDKVVEVKKGTVKISTKQHTPVLAVKKATTRAAPAVNSNAAKANPNEEARRRSIEERMGRLHHVSLQTPSGFKSSVSPNITSSILDNRNFVKGDPVVPLKWEERVLLERKSNSERDLKENNLSSVHPFSFWKNLENNHSGEQNQKLRRPRADNSLRRNVVVETKLGDGHESNILDGKLQTGDSQKAISLDNTHVVASKNDLENGQRKVPSSKFQISKSLGSKVSKFFKGDKNGNGKKSGRQVNIKVLREGSSCEVLETKTYSEKEKEKASKPPVSSAEGKGKNLHEGVLPSASPDSNSKKVRVTAAEVPNFAVNISVTNEENSLGVAIPIAPERCDKLSGERNVPNRDAKSGHRKGLDQPDARFEGRDFVSDSDESADVEENIREEVVYQEENTGKESLFYVLGSFRKKDRRPHALNRSFSARERGLKYRTEYKEQRSSRSLPSSPRVSVRRTRSRSVEGHEEEHRARTPILFTRTTTSDNSLWRSKSESHKYGFTVALVGSRSGSLVSNISDMDDSVASSGFWGNWETSIDDLNDETFDHLSRADLPSRSPNGVLETDLDLVMSSTPFLESGAAKISSHDPMEKMYLMPTFKKLSSTSLKSSSTVSLSGDDSSCSTDSLRRSSKKTVTVRKWPQKQDNNSHGAKKRCRSKELTGSMSPPLTGTSLLTPRSRQPIVSGRVPSPAIGLDYKDLFSKQHSDDGRKPGDHVPLPVRNHHEVPGTEFKETTVNPQKRMGTEADGLSSSKGTFTKGTEEESCEEQLICNQYSENEALKIDKKPPAPKLDTQTSSVLETSVRDSNTALSFSKGEHETVRPTPRRLVSHTRGENADLSHVTGTPLETSFRPILHPQQERSRGLKPARDHGGSLTLDDIETDGLYSDDTAIFSDASYFDSIGLLDEGSLAERCNDRRSLTSDSSLQDVFTVGSDDMRRRQRDVPCAYPMCSKIPKTYLSSHSTYSSCVACFRYYCSRECRRLDWPDHKRTCYYGRVHFYVKALVRRLEESKDLSFYLSQMAVDNFRARGKGAVVIHFTSPMALKLFLIERTNVFPEAPVYSTLQELETSHDVSPSDNNILHFARGYHANREYVVDVTVAVRDSVQQQQYHKDLEGKWESIPLRRCVILGLHPEFATLVHNDYSPSAYEIKTFRLPKVIRHNSLDDEEARRQNCGELSRNLRLCGVFLKRNYPEQYHQLCLYVERNQQFEPMHLFGKDRGKTVKCVVYPEDYGGSETSIESSETGVLI